MNARDQMTTPTSGYTTKEDIKSNEKKSDKSLQKEKSRKARGACAVSPSTSHTQYLRRDSYLRDEFKRITTNEFCGMSAESSAGSSDTFNCVHGPKGKQYTERGHLKRNLVKNLDPIKLGSRLVKDCPPALGWDMASKLVFLIRDTVGVQQIDRLQQHLQDFAKTASSGYRIDTLNNLCVILHYLVDTVENKLTYYRQHLKELLKNTAMPILLIANSDVITHFEFIADYIGFLGSLLVTLEDDDLFELLSKGVLYQMSCPDKARGPSGASQRHVLLAARTVLPETVARMIATARPLRFPTFIHIALLLACDSEESCYALLMENIIENIFYRFNPYFPDRGLPVYDINPSDLKDDNVRLGESSNNLDTILSLLLVLLKAAKEFADQNPKNRDILPCPDDYSQRCFVWAYRYECRAEHRHNRTTLTVVVQLLVHIYGERLVVLCNDLMPDVMTLSVLTEIPPRDDWTSSVSFNVTQKDVLFKQYLIHLSFEFLKLYQANKCLARHRHWIVGLMYLVDPGLSSLRFKWPGVLYCELRKTALQALTLSIPLVSPDIPTDISLIRRIMWYIEWFSEIPYDLPVLYWSVRLVQSSMDDRSSPYRRSAVQELIHTHGVIIIINLCKTLMAQKLPPVNKKQAIIGLNLRLLTSCLEYKDKVSCSVYPEIRWPSYTNRFVQYMMSVVLHCLEKCTNFTDRWLLSLLNLIWEAIVWKKPNREMFAENNGVYQILDIIVMSSYPVQCLALALVCDVMREGTAVSQLVTWRATLHAAHSMNPPLVKPGATIASLLAAIFKKSCQLNKIKLDGNNVIQNLDFPLMTQESQKYMISPEFMSRRHQRTPFCLSASEIGGSLLSKCYAIFEMLSKDLAVKVDLADDSYKLYKNIQLDQEEETILVLVSHYLTIKLNETWLETQIQSHGFVPVDTNIMGEFLHIGRGWAKSIQQKQLEVIKKFKNMEESQESNLYSFLKRVRLNTALDTLRQVKCAALTADRASITHALIHDAVQAYHRLSSAAARLHAPVVQTYGPPLDIFNVIGQNVKLINIIPKNRPKKREDFDLISHTSLRSQDLPAAEIPEKALSSYEEYSHDKAKAREQIEQLQPKELIEPDEVLLHTSEESVEVSHGSQNSAGSRSSQKVSLESQDVFNLRQETTEPTIAPNN